MIDEYDQLMRRINLMSRFSPEQIQERTWAIGSQPTFALVHIEGGKVSVTCATLDAEIVREIYDVAILCKRREYTDILMFTEAKE